MAEIIAGVLSRLDALSLTVSFILEKFAISVFVRLTNCISMNDCGTDRGGEKGVNEACL